MQNASWGLRFISAMINSGDFNAIARFKVTPDVLNPEERPVLSLIVEYYNNPRHFGCLPPMELLTDRFPQHRLGDIRATPEDMPVLAERIHHDYLAGHLRDTALRLARHADRNPWEGLNYLSVRSQELHTRHEAVGDDYRLAESKERVVTNLRIRMNSGGLIGLPWYWENMNSITGGILSAGMYGFYGRPKTEKTFIKTLLGVFLYSIGYRVLLVNTEMAKEELELRAVCAKMRLDYNDFLHNVTPALVESVEQELDALHEAEEMEATMGTSGRTRCFVITDDVLNITNLRGKIAEVQPNIVLIDSAHELEDEQNAKRDHARQRNVAKGIRQITRDKRLGRPPIVYSIHANREGDKEVAGGYNEVAGSDQWGKSSDALFRIVRVRDPQTNDWILAILPPAGGGRSFVWDGMIIGARPFTDLNYHRDTCRDEVLSIIEAQRESSTDRAQRRITNAAARSSQPDITTAQWVNNNMLPPGEGENGS